MTIREAIEAWSGGEAGRQIRFNEEGVCGLEVEGAVPALLRIVEPEGQDAYLAFGAYLLPLPEFPCDELLRAVLALNYLRMDANRLVLAYDPAEQSIIACACLPAQNLEPDAFFAWLDAASGAAAAVRSQVHEIATAYLELLETDNEAAAAAGAEGP